MVKRGKRFLSLFSGIEAASVAWTPLGWECVGVAEIEPFPCHVLAYHYPEVPNLGDVTKITEDKIKALGPIDLVVFGSPCQDLSVAGKRKGLAGARSGLFHVALRIFGWARKHCGARWALWENVPGAFSSNKGADFAIVVGAMAGCGDVDVPAHGWGSEGVALGDHGLLEWSTLDAQWFGVAQRRRRVFALLDTGNWSGRPPVLLEPESLRGDTAPRREAPEDVTPAVTHCLRAGGFDGSEDGTGRGTPLVAMRRGFGVEAWGISADCFDRSGEGANATPGERSGLGITHELSPTLRANRPNAVGYGIVGALTSAHGPNGPGGSGLATDKGAEAGHIIPVALAFVGANTAGEIDVATACNAKGGAGRMDFDSETFIVEPLLAFNVNAQVDEMNFSSTTTPALTCSQQAGVVQPEYGVRRLMPTECEQLQAFPVGYTRIPIRHYARRKITKLRPADMWEPAAQGGWWLMAADGPRYKALGNSMCAKVMRKIGEAIDQTELFQ